VYPWRTEDFPVDGGRLGLDTGAKGGCTVGKELVRSQDASSSKGRARAEDPVKGGLK